jgi:hypothetical protein
MKMIDKIAETMCVNRKFIWSNCNKTYWRNQAIAGINALREPSEEMIAELFYLLDTQGRDQTVKASWNLLIDAILQENAK